jgi:hypothetical protein
MKKTLSPLPPMIRTLDLTHLRRVAGGDTIDPQKVVEAKRGA